jgi:hypothetical protein
LEERKLQHQEDEPPGTDRQLRDRALVALWELLLVMPREVWSMTSMRVWRLKLQRVTASPKSNAVWKALTSTKKNDE